MRIELVLARGALAALLALGTVAPAGAQAQSAAPGTGSLGVAKAAREAREEAEHAAAPRALKHPGFLRRTAAAAIPWRSGIIESGLAPLPGALYAIANQWHGNLNGRHVIVYAGALRRQPSVGVLVVSALSLDGTAGAAPQVLTLPGSGAARIASAAGTTLTVATASGRVLPFQVPSNQPLARAQ